VNLETVNLETVNLSEPIALATPIVRGSTRVCDYPLRMEPQIL